MASIASVATLLTAGLTAATGVTGMGQQNRAAQAEADRMSALAQRDAEAAARDQEAIAREREQSERERRNALRRAVASQRARLGAQGVSSADGSGEALLLGLVQESALDASEAEQERRAALKAIEEDLSARRSVNLLDQKRHRLNQPTVLDQVSDVAGAVGPLTSEVSTQFFGKRNV